MKSNLIPERALERKGLLISETRRTEKGRCVFFKISPTTVLKARFSFSYTTNLGNNLTFSSG